MADIEGEINDDELMVDETVSVCEIRPDADADEDKDELLVAETVAVIEMTGLIVISEETLLTSDNVTVLEM